MNFHPQNNKIVKIIFKDTYNKFLIKKGNYFAYLSISCPPELLDVNVRSNKSEVFFQNEDLLLQNFGNLLESILREEINSKNYYAGEYKGFESDNKKQNEILFDENKDKKNIYAKDKIRVDNKNISIERYISLLKVDSKQRPKSEEDNNNMDIEPGNNEINFIQKKIEKDNQLNFANLILKEIYQNLFLQEKDINKINEQKNNEDIVEEEKSEDNNNEIDEDENKINYGLNNIFKEGIYIGYIKNNFCFTLQYQTSMYLINTRALLQEYFFYQLLISHNGNNSFVENIKISSESFSLEKLFSFISEQFSDNEEKNNHAKTMLEKIDYIKSNIIPTTKILSKGIIEFNEDNLINKIKIVNFFKNDKFIVFCMDYIPLIYFSIIEHIYFSKEENSKIQENKNINCIIDIIKIISYYYATAYLDFLKNENEEFIKYRISRILATTKISKKGGVAKFSPFKLWI